jgi:CheY-like chemotaxis protein
MPGTVLIVEDDEPTQKLLETLMSRNGVACVVAPNGGAAIELLDSRDDIGCMILDLMMPAVDGHSVLSHVAARERRVPVIVCSATNMRPQSFDESVVRAVVQKPFDIAQMMALVASLLE